MDYVTHSLFVLKLLLYQMKEIIFDLSFWITVVGKATMGTF